MLAPALPLSEGPGYGYGLGVEIDTEDGYRRVGHQGDCPGYCGYAYGCLETGVGVVAVGNGPWRAPGPASTWAVVEHGLALLRAAALGQELPDDPPPADPDPPPEVPRPPRPPGTSPPTWPRWSAPTPPGTRGCRNSRSGPTPAVPAWSSSTRTGTRRP